MRTRQTSSLKSSCFTAFSLAVVGEYFHPELIPDVRISVEAAGQRGVCVLPGVLSCVLKLIQRRNQAQVVFHGVWHVAPPCFYSRMDKPTKKWPTQGSSTRLEGQGEVQTEEGAR